jgi:hypothetical protein
MVGFRARSLPFWAFRSGYLSTGRKQGLNLWTALQQSMAGGQAVYPATAKGTPLALSSYFN